MLQAPTGFGKTVLAGAIVQGALAKGKRVIITLPALSLIDQTFDRFVENGIDPSRMGVIQGDHPYRRPQAPVQIATAQTLARRDRPDVDVVIVDEAYVDFAPADCLGPLRGHPNWLVVRTFSKGYAMAGLRIGYGIANPEVLEKLKNFYAGGPSYIAASIYQEDQELINWYCEVDAEKFSHLLASTSITNMLANSHIKK